MERYLLAILRYCISGTAVYVHWGLRNSNASDVSLANEKYSYILSRLAQDNIVYFVPSLIDEKSIKRVNNISGFISNEIKKTNYLRRLYKQQSINYKIMSIYF